MSTKTISSVVCATTLFVALFCGPTLAQNGNCEIEGVLDEDWVQSLDFDVLDTNAAVIFEGTATNVNEINTITQSSSLNSQQLYVEPKLVGGKFILSPTAHFAEYEEQETMLNYGLSLDFTCQSLTRTLFIRIAIVDTNNHPPEFLPGDNYEYKILTPMPPGIPISTFYGAIQVRDYDLTTERIIFDIDANDYLELVYDTVDDSKKVHTGILKTKNAILRLDEPLVLQISATDVDKTGDDPITRSATITLTSDPLTQLPTAPQFSSTYYSGTIKDGELTFEKQIEISVGYTDNIILTVSNEFPYFSVTNDGEIVTIAINGAIPEDVLAARDHFLFSLLAAKENTEGGSAAIYISIPKEVLKFEKSSYKGSYDEALSIEGIVLEGYNDKVELHLSGDSTEFFDFTVDGSIVQIISKEKLPEVVMEGTNNRLVLLLEATSPNDYATTTILIELPEKVPDPAIEFVDIVHKATYSYSDNIFSIDPIQLKPGFPTDLTFDLSGDAKDYFTAELQGNSVKISTSGGIPESLAADNPYTVLTLQASATKSINAYAFITVALLIDPIPDPIIEFVEIVHKATYTYSDKTFSMGPVELKPGYPSDLVIGLSGDAKDYFTAELHGNSVIISTTPDIPESLAADSPYTVLTVQASSAANSINAYAVITVALVIDPVPDPTIEFVEIIHKATYTYSDLVFEIEPIKLKPGYPSDLVIELSGDAKDYFTAELQGNSVIISTTPDIPESLAADSPYTVLTVQASSAAYSANAYAVITVALVIDPVPDPTIEFVEIIHKATYTYSDLIFEIEPIELKPGYPSDLVIEISGDAKDYFTAELQGNSVIISTTPDIPESLAADSPYTVLTVQASSAVYSVNAYAVITVALVIDPAIDTIIEFVEIVHKATYTYSDKIFSMDPIELKAGFPSDLTINLSGDGKDYFTAEVQGNSVIISTTQDIPESLAADSPYTVLTVQASSAANSVNAYAVITVELLLEDPEKIIEFIEIVHKASYSFKDKILTISPIQLKTGFPSDIAFEFSGDAKEHFSAELQGDSVMIIASPDIPESLAVDSPYTVLTLKASAANTGNAYTVITISLVDGPGEITQTILVFEKPLYDAIYSENHVISVPDIKLNEEVSEVTFKLSGEHAGFFGFNQEGSTVKIELKDPLTDDILSSNSHIALILEAEGDNAVKGVTVINVELPKKDEVMKPTLAFESPYYQASYSAEELTTPEIALTVGSPAQFKLSGENAGFFTATSDDGISVAIGMAKPLTNDILSKNSYIVVVLEAEAPDALDGLTIINIALPNKDDSFKEVLQFEKPLYQGTYSPENGLVLEPAILTKGFSSAVSVSLSTDFKEYFTTTVVGSTVTIELRQPLTSDILDSYSVLSIVLEAQVEGAINGHTIISITLPEHEDVDKKVLRFEKNVYNAAYLKETTLIVPLVKLTEEVPGVVFQILGDNANLFIVSQVGSTAHIALKEAFTDDVLTSNSYVALVLEAKAVDAVNGQAVINIALPTKDEIVKPTMTFRSPYYQASYSVENQLNTPEIALISGSPAKPEFKLSGDNARFFEATSEDGISVTIKVKTPLTDDILNKNSYIVIVLEAEAQGALDGLTIINIALPEKDDSSKKVLRFEKPLYQGTYSPADGLVLEPAVLTEEFSSAVSVSLSTDFKEYFTTTVVGSTVTIELRQPLTSDILDSYSVLSLVLEAQVEGAINGHTIISITLPEHEDVDKKVLKFEKNVYDAAYLKETTLIVPLVKLTEEVPGVVFQILGDNANLFIVSQVGSTAYIALKEAFTDDVLSSNSYVALVLEAKAEDAVNGQAVINIALPTKDEVVKPTMTFRSPYYQASYSVENQLNTPEIALISGSPAKPEFKLSGDNARFFEATSEDGISVTIKVKTPLTDDILNKNSYIVIVLEAEAPGALDGLTIINIALPEKDNSEKKVLQFEKPLYQGTYSPADGLVLEPAILTDEFTSVVSVSLSTDFKEYFTTTVVGSTVTIELRQPLTSDILDSYSVLSLVLEAQVEGAINGHTIISITLPEHEDVDKKMLKFEKNVYDAAYLKETTLIVPLVKLTEEVPGVVFHILGDNANLFIVSQVGSTAYIALKEAFTDDVLTSNSYVALVLEAKAEDAVNGQAVINIALPTIDEIVKPTMTFRSPYYQASYSVENQLNTPEIALITGSPSKPQFKLSGDNARFFEATSEDGISVTIDVKTPLTDDILSKNSYIVIVLEAEAPGALDGLTIINIALPEKDDVMKPTLAFEYPYYQASYSAEELTTPEIALTVGSPAQFKLSGDNSDFFTATSDDGISVAIRVAKPLTNDILSKNSYIVVVLEAEAPDALDGLTIINIALPNKDDSSKKVLQFEKPLYQGTYSPADGLVLEPAVLTEEFTSAVSVSLSTDFKEYFTTTVVGSTVTIELRQPLPSDILDSYSVLSLVLEAQVEGAINGHTIISITLPEHEDVDKKVLKFEKNLYDAAYLKETTLIVPLIKLTEEVPGVVFQILGDNANLFIVTQVGSTAYIALKEAFTDDVLSSNSYIALVLEAKAEDAVNGQAVINIALPAKDEIVKPTMTFRSPYYQASYSVENQLNTPEIALITGSPSKPQFKLSGDNAHFFEVTSEDGISVTIEVKTPLTDDILSKNSYIVIILEAEAPGALDGLTIINIALPEKDDSSKKVLQFEKPFYQGTYSPGDGLVLEPAILTEEFTSAVSVSLSTDFKEYFTTTVVGSTVTIELRQPLTSDILDSYSVLSLVLEAQVEGAINGHTIISITLPEHEDVDKKVLKFEKNVYDAAYLKETTLIVPLVKLTEEVSGVVFQILGDNANLFIVSQVGSTAYIALKEAFTDDVLSSNSYIALVLKAKAEDAVNGQAVINIALPTIDEIVKPTMTFRSPYYQASYSVENQLNTPEIALITGSPSKPQFKLSGDNAHFFEVTSEDGISVTIEVKTPLTDDILSKNSYIVIILEAEAPGALDGLTVINIALPEKDDSSKKVLQFEKPLYQGTYSPADGLVLEPAILTDEFTSVVSVSLSTDFKEYFTTTVVGSTVTIELRQPLTSDILDSYSVLSLVLEAQVEGAINGHTIISITLPEHEDVDKKVLKFEKNVYDAAYLKETTLIVPLVKLTEEVPGVVFQILGDNANLFIVSQVGSTAYIALKEAFTDDVLSSNSYVALVLEAKAEDAVNGQAVINIALPTIDEIVKPTMTFRSPYYQASYSVENQLNTPEIALITGSPSKPQFKLSGDNAHFFEVTSEDGISVTIEVKTPLTDDILSKNSYIVIILEAEAPGALDGLTVINIALPEKDDSSKKVLQFEKPLYQGTYSPADGLVLEPAILTDEFTSVVSVSLSTDFKEYFTTTVVGSTVTIELRQPLTSDILDSYSVLSLVLEAQVEGAINGHTIISITLPEHEDVDKKVLKFEKNVYDAAYLKETTLIVPLVKLTEEVPGVVFQILGDNANLFIVSQVGSTAYIALKEAFTDDVLSSNSYVALVLEAKAEDAVNGQAVINIALPTKDEIVKPTMTFRSPYYQASYSVENQLNTPEIALISGSPAKPEFKLSGDNARFFEATSDDGISVSILVKTPLTDDILSKNSYIVIVLEAEAPGALDGLTIINIALPGKDPQISVKFEENFYIGSYAFSTDQLTLSDMTLEEGYSTDVEFALVGEYSQLFKTSAVGNVVTLNVDGTIPENVLEQTSVLVFSLQATRPDAPTATTVIAIKLIRRTGTPGNALTIIDISEGEVNDHLDIGELDDGCKYRIVSKWPPTTPDWFYTDSDGKLKSNIVLREDPSVANLYLSQTQLEMAIDCVSKPTQENLREGEDEERFWISTKNINLEENKKLVTIIIKDINNNPPVFDLIGPVTVGFPANEIAYVIRPQSLITVHATDADIDLNALIKYTTQSDHFAVHPDTGVVYPKTDLYSIFGNSEELSFTVVATDRYGDGHEVSLEIMVKLLDESHITVVRIENGVMENVNEIIDALSSQTKYAIKVLSATVLPDSDIESKIESNRQNKASLVSREKKDLSGDDTELTMFIYALDSQNNFVKASEISNFISSGDAALPWEVKGETLFESSLLLRVCATSDNTGLIVGISVLGVLLFITLAGMVAYYFLVIRKKYSSFTNSSSGSSVTSSEDSEADTKAAEVDYISERPATQVDSENLASNLSHVINPSFNTNDHSDQLNTDKDIEANNAHPKEENSSDIDDDEYGRKKSIRFNPTVMQIDFDASDLMEDERL